MSNQPKTSEILELNKEAMKYLKSSDFESALSLLTEAEAQLKALNVKPSSSLWGVTLNNLGCYYRKARKPTIALHYFERALGKEDPEEKDLSNTSGAHLNMCGVLSELGDHELALLHAKKVVKMLKAHAHKQPALAQGLILGFKHLGIEYSFLSQKEEAAKSFKIGWELAEQVYGVESPVTESLKNLFISTKHKEKPKVRNVIRFKSPDRNYLRDAYLRATSKVRNSPVYKHSPRFLTGERLKPMHNTAKPKIKRTSIALPNRKKRKAASISVQVGRNEQISLKRAAVLIENAWIKFKEYRDVGNYEEQMRIAQENVQRALKEVQRIQRKKDSFDLRTNPPELAPVPRRNRF